MHSLKKTIYHVDEKAKNKSSHYKVAVVQADGLSQIEADTSIGDKGDIFTPGDTLNDNTTPNIQSYQDNN